MQTRLIKLRWRRRLRKSQRQVEDISSQAEAQIEQHVFKRFEHLFAVRYFVIGWVSLIILLIIGVVVQNINLSGYYQVLKPVPGGIYSEGVAGTFTNANPIYASSDADNTLSSLIFAGLLKSNGQGQLVGDLASGYNVDDKGMIYTVHLKPHLTWQDGQPLTAKDVVFTIHTIQNPDAQSPLFSSWQGIDVSAPTPDTVVFKLPDVLASFPYELTLGILPEHLLSQVPADDLRSANFNTINPVGAGPFAWQAIQVLNGSNPEQEQVQIALRPFAGYNGGKPKLDKFIVNTYADQDQLITAFKNKHLTAMESATPPPLAIQRKHGVIDHSFLLRAATMVFFKTSSGVLADQSVRNALVEGADVPKIIANLGYSTKPVNEPLLIGQLAYNPLYAQASYNLDAAKQILKTDGWVTSSNGYSYKNKQPLAFTLTAEDTPEDQMVTNELKTDWQKLGLRLTVQLLDPTDFQTAISYHEYDAILSAISIGVDPDVFVYWDSSQADIRSANRLNLSEFKNSTADISLESGRTRLDPALRVIKYQAFLQTWQQASPALGLYQPRLLYLTNGKVGGLYNQELSTPTDRFNNVQNWEINEAKVSR